MEDFSQAMAMILLIKKHLNLKKLLCHLGVCDEDMYHKAIKIMNQEAKQVNRFSITYDDGK
jgi:hypothetical protein